MCIRDRLEEVRLVPEAEADATVCARIVDGEQPRTGGVWGLWGSERFRVGEVALQHHHEDCEVVVEHLVAAEHPHCLVLAAGDPFGEFRMRIPAVPGLLCR